MNSFQDLESAFERCFLKLTGAYDLQPEETKEPALLKLGNQIGMRFITTDSIDCLDFSYEAPTDQQLERVIKPLVFELNLYPREGLRRTRIEQVILCNELQLGRYKKKAAGTLKVGLHFVDTIFIDVQAFRDDQFGRHTVHHELFHAIDFRDTWEGLVDTDWHNLQESGHRYELDDAIAYHTFKRRDPEAVGRPKFDDPYDWLTSKPSSAPGFLTEYARHSVVEDKAEVFSHLMSSYAAVMERCAHDETLKRKVERMKQLISHFCSEMDDDFWQRVSDCRRHD